MISHLEIQSNKKQPILIHPTKQLNTISSHHHIFDTTIHSGLARNYMLCHPKIWDIQRNDLLHIASLNTTICVRTNCYSTKIATQKCGISKRMKLQMNHIFLRENCWADPTWMSFVNTFVTAKSIRTNTTWALIIPKWLMLLPISIQLPLFRTYYQSENK